MCRVSAPAPEPDLADMRKTSVVLAALMVAAAGGCASGTGGGAPTTSGGSTAPSGSDASGTIPAKALPVGPTQWPVRTSAHVDLWLHSFALISTDTILVPLYRRGYRDSVSAVRSRGNILTSLDGNRETLARGLAASPSYLQAQFLAFEFVSWDAMRGAAEQFLQFQGEPRRSPDEATAARVAQFASIFPTPADREWLRLFVASVQDENTRWFAGEHARLVRDRARVTAAVETLWINSYRTKFERFLNNTGQRFGDMLLSAPVGGEGRAGNGQNRQTVVAVGWPGRVEDAREALLTFAHEITGSLVGGVISDNTTPAEKRDGQGDRFVAIGQVRAGALLLEKVAPELLDGYMRYYLSQSGTRADGGANAAFERLYRLPPAIVSALQRQIDIVLGGI